MNLRKLLNLPFLVLCLFLIVLTCGNIIQTAYKEHIYAIILFIKDIIVFCLPFIIFSFVLHGILNLKKESIKVIIILVPLVCLSNFTGFWVSYIFASPFLKSGIIEISRIDAQIPLNAAWHLTIPTIIKNDVALIASMTLGIIGNFSKTNMIERLSNNINNVANILLKKVICPLLPMFVLGFIVKMQHEGTLLLIMKEYSMLLCLVAVLAYGYMFLVMFFISNRNLNQTIQKFKNLLPSVLIGLFSMSSAAAIPSTIEGSEKNLKNKNIAKFVVPATANMHLLGDCFAIPIIALALMVSFGIKLPSISQYFILTLYGVLAKFAAAGIPGGSVLIFVPILHDILGFTPEMLTAITAIYVMFDPIATSSNVFGHGMFALLFEKVYTKYIKSRTISN